jgi:hypothetical protein
MSLHILEQSVRKSIPSILVIGGYPKVENSVRKWTYTKSVIYECFYVTSIQTQESNAEFSKQTLRILVANIY